MKQRVQLETNLTQIMEHDMSTVAKIVDPRVMTMEVTDDEIITDDQRAIGLVMALSGCHPGAATTLGDSW
jgi:hypothetical protein